MPAARERSNRHVLRCQNNFAAEIERER